MPVSSTVAPSLGVAPRAHAEVGHAGELLAVRRRAALAGEDDDLRRRGRVVGDRVRRRARATIATSPRAQEDRLARCRATTHASPRTTATSVSGASSSMRSDHGGSMLERSRNAPRARGPSRRPATASMPRHRRRSRMRLRDSSYGTSHRSRGSLRSMSTQHAAPPTLVLGATGKTGRRVVERLEARGVPVRVGSRSARPAVRLGRPRDVGRRRSTASTRRRTSPTSPTSRCPARPTTVGAFAAHGGRSAASSGSSCCPAAARRRPSAPRSASRPPAPTGRSCAAHGSRRTSARASCSTPILAGELALPADDVPEPFVDADDIADVAVAALTEDGHAGRALRAHRPAAADLRRGGRGDRRGDRARDRASCRVPLDEYAAALADDGVPRRRRSS